MKREAGTKFMGLDKTGTADWQRPAAWVRQDLR
jgi:hypothetical protein